MLSVIRKLTPLQEVWLVAQAPPDAETSMLINSLKFVPAAAANRYSTVVATKGCVASPMFKAKPSSPYGPSAYCLIDWPKRTHPIAIASFMSCCAWTCDTVPICRSFEQLL